MTSELYIGLMSGTSLDGIDAALVRFDRPEIIVGTHFECFDPSLRTALIELLQPGNDEIHRSAVAAQQLSLAYAHAVGQLLAAEHVDPSHVAAIGCHGQTIRHNPAAGYTTQIGNGALLAEATGITVVCDFRSRDMAAGGQGAPLVPAFHARFFASADVDRVIVNIGGIANITYVPGLASGRRVLGFDSGPGNTLMDEWIRSQRGENFDANGAWSHQGSVVPELLVRLASDPYFERAPPKSTGRELFNLDWLRQQGASRYSPVDVQATLCELSADTIAQALARYFPHVREAYVCGGGAANVDLLDRLRGRLDSVALGTTGALGIPPDWVEAVAFAWLARETLAGRPGNLPEVTGASGPRTLGCIYPA